MYDEWIVGKIGIGKHVLQGEFGFYLYAWWNLK